MAAHMNLDQILPFNMDTPVCTMKEKAEGYCTYLAGLIASIHRTKNQDRTLSGLNSMVKELSQRPKYEQENDRTRTSKTYRTDRQLMYSACGSCNGRRQLLLAVQPMACKLLQKRRDDLCCHHEDVMPMLCHDN